MSAARPMQACSQNGRRSLELALQSDEWGDDFSQPKDCSLVLTP